MSPPTGGPVGPASHGTPAQPQSAADDEPPPAYGYPAGQHPAFGASASRLVGGAGETPGYSASEHGLDATLADLDERELPNGWERCYDGL